MFIVVGHVPPDVFLVLVVGDDRPNVVPSIGAIHTIFMREHNRIAETMNSINPNWDDENIYQESRRIMSAILQHITYTEYLPLILGRPIMRQFELLSKSRRLHRTHNDTINAGIANVFAAAAFRFGHSQIPSFQAFIGKDFKFRREFNIEKTYHRPSYVYYDKGKGVDNVIRWLVNDRQPETDR